MQMRQPWSCVPFALATPLGCRFTSGLLPVWVVETTPQLPGGPGRLQASQLPQLATVRVPSPVLPGFVAREGNPVRDMALATADLDVGVGVARVFPQGGEFGQMLEVEVENVAVAHLSRVGMRQVGPARGPWPSRRSRELLLGEAKRYLLGPPRHGPTMLELAHGIVMT